MTVEQLEVRMTHREFVLQRIYDRLREEAHEELAADNRLLAQHARRVG